MEKIDNLLSQGRLEDGQYKFLSFMMLLPDVSNDDALIITLSMFNDGLSTVRIEIHRWGRVAERLGRRSRRGCRPVFGRRPVTQRSQPPRYLSMQFVYVIFVLMESNIRWIWEENASDVEQP